MSLVALALRTATVLALTNATLAGKRVYDSAIDPIDQRSEDPEPVIIVYTDDDLRTVTGRDMNNASRRLDLVVEIACAQKVLVTPPEGDPFEAFEIPHTDAGLEQTLNVIERQAMRVLQSDQGVWAALWRSAVTSIEKIAAKRGAGADKGVRFAAHQIVLTAETLSEPPFGRPAEGFWLDFIAALEDSGEEGLQSLAGLIRFEIEAPSLVEWRRGLADLASNPSTGVAIGIAPVPTAIPPQEGGDPYPQPDEAPAPISEIEAADEAAGITWDLDEAAADDALGPAPDA